MKDNYTYSEAEEFEKDNLLDDDYLKAVNQDDDEDDYYYPSYSNSYEELEDY